STDVGGIPEMIEDKKTGLLVKPADALTLADNIKLLMENKILRLKLSGNSQKKVKTEFSLKKMIEETKKNYV
ncbi:glycosyltransferase, partial [Candidatus Falkowbacteria bacterium]|nr:glycosyltransferase [Candidatus Falkowbacteria bacterium]